MSIKEMNRDFIITLSLEQAGQRALTIELQENGYDLWILGVYISLYFLSNITPSSASLPDMRSKLHFRTQNSKACSEKILNGNNRKQNLQGLE